eukprot:TRINITY_DN18194_c0_g1_i1.p1 TRINITY_DN18194_c0_g1~~TRINITY_DN18194_c0_g1_i1.p1  ORF type:complete len:102 (+),score=59.56 TRINITY_DN18194_c0_g1_i1:138-443(+)
MCIRDSGKNLLAEIDVRAFQPHDQRHVQADFLRRRDNAFGDHVTTHDAAEDVDQDAFDIRIGQDDLAVSYTHLRAHETVLDLVCRLLLEKKKNKHTQHKLR